MDAIEKVLHECGQKPQALMILGPTAGGKSALSLEIARRHDVEIISMDSALVYRGMDIGTAKPTKEERAVCPHHLIDIRDIGEAYSAADFLEDAVRLVGEIHSRGRLPLIVGGTMLYAKALRDGINDMPSSTHEVREAVATEAAERGWPAMHAELGRIDPVTAARLAPNDSQRIGRALEVWKMTGRPISAFHAESVRRPAVETLTMGLLPLWFTHRSIPRREKYVVGALLAKEVVRRVPTVDYPLLIASAYSGFVIWHAGLSGSIPLDLVAGKAFGEVTYQAPITATVFHPVNIIMCVVILIAMPFINYAMHPDKAHTVCIDPTLLQDEEDKTYEIKTPADRIEHSKILWVILVVAGFAYIVYYFVQNGFTLGLNIVNMIFLFLGILLHGDLRRYVDAIGEAAAGAAGILLQFPFYAGIMGMMVAANEQGVSLASVISQFFVNISNSITFPMLSFLAAGIVNFFVPSGGGQWAVQGPIMMPAGANLGIDAGRTAMAIAWGDQWTNMIQPFWALPALGIAKLSARDIMGYLVIVTLFVGVVACLGFLAWAAWF